MSYLSYIAPWVVILVYLIFFVISAIVLQSVNLNGIIKTDQKFISVLIYIFLSVALAFLVGSFFLIIIGASTAAVNQL